MSYDLYFCSDNDHRVALQDVEGYLSAQPNFSQRWKYENSSTGVIFSLLDRLPGRLAGEILLPQGWWNTGISLRLEPLRPAYYAREALRVVENLTRQFGFWVLDPQDYHIGGVGALKPASSEELLESWLANNQMALREARRQGKKFLYLPRQRADQWWQYQYHVDVIRQRMEEPIYVPSLSLLIDQQDSRIYTYLVWTEALPFVFPPVDMVVTVRRDKKNLYKKNNLTKGWLPAYDLRKRLAPHMLKIVSEAGHLDMLPPEKAHTAEEIFNNLPLTLGLRSFSRISTEQLVDEE